jgi:hypothetical protein
MARTEEATDKAAERPAEAAAGRGEEGARSRHPRFNHVAMSLPAELLDEAGRRDILSFYEGVFGWKEHPSLTEDRRRLVMQVYSYNQFVFLIADDAPMTAPRMDHFGIQVDTMEELDRLLGRCRSYQDKDPRVDIVDKSADVYPGMTITSFYVRYLLPMMVEVQHFSANEVEPVG